jgi:putative DNA primase/helicase
MSNINICAQDAYLALHPQSKKPVGVNWPDEGKSREQALATNGNLGLLLRPKSDVMDVDLDCEKQRALLN